jgi:hypothetical protein
MLELTFLFDPEVLDRLDMLYVCEPQLAMNV